MSTFAFYRKVYTVALKSRAEYRADFVVSVITAFLMQLAALSFYWVVFSKVPALGGWSAAGVLSLFGVSAMVLSLSELLFNGIWQLPTYILSGELDRLLVYPVNGLLFLLMSRPELHALGNFTSGAIMLGVAWSMQPPDLAAYALLPIWLASGTVVYTSALVAVGCLSFVIVGPWSHHYFIAFHLLNATRYPVSIYPRWLQYILLFIVPFAATSFVPMSWAMGYGRLWPALLVPPAAAVASAVAAFALFRTAIRRYQSSGT
jgi:ABC-2 type transport system permease protein